MNKAFSNFTWENDPSVNTPLSAENLNRVNKAVNEIDNRVISHDTTKANQVDMLSAITNVTFDESTGKFTFIRHNGTMVVLDTKLEKLILNWRFDNTTQILYMVLEDGSEMPVDLSAFITNVEFVDSTTIRAVIGTDGKVAFEIIDGSITSNKLQPNYLADIQLEATKASQSATNAQESADNAEASAVRAEEAAQIAQSVSKVDIATTSKAGIVKPDGTTITVDTDGTIHGVGGGGDVTKEDLENYLPKTGGEMVGRVTIDYDGSVQPGFRVDHTTSGKCIELHVNQNGDGGIYDFTSKQWVVQSKKNGKIHHYGDLEDGNVYSKVSSTSGGAAIGIICKNNDNSVFGGVGCKAQDGVGEYMFMGAGSGYYSYVNNFSVWADNVKFKNNVIHHAGNKPSGTYTGNGSSASRTISTGGIGRMLLVYPEGSNEFVIVTPQGAIRKTSSTLAGLKADYAYYVNGELHLATSGNGLNDSGVTYYYQCI